MILLWDFKKTPALSSSCLGCELSRGSWACLYPGFRFLLLLELRAKFLTKHSNRGGIKKPQIIQSGLRFVCQHSGVALVRKRRKKLVLKLRIFNSWAVFLVSFSPDFGCWMRNHFGSLGFVSASCLPDFSFVVSLCFCHRVAVIWIPQCWWSYNCRICLSLPKGICLYLYLCLTIEIQLKKPEDFGAVSSFVPQLWL